MTDPGIAYDPTIWRHYDPLGKPHTIPTAGIFDEPTIRLCVNSTWLGHISGMVDRLAWSDAWQGNENEVNAAIQEIYKFFDACGRFETGGCSMGDCCNQAPAGNKPVRFSPTTGRFEVSYDNGTTWVDSPQYDPRNGLIVYPPTNTDTGYAKKCAAANSVRTAYKDQFDQLAAVLQANQTLAQIAAAVIGLLIVAGIIATGGIFAAFGAFLATLLSTLGYTGWIALNTTAHWQALTCAVFRTLDADGKIDPARFANFQQYYLNAGGANDQFMTWAVQSWINIGVMGNQNFISNNVHHDDYDCSTCIACLSGWTIDSTYGASQEVVAGKLRLHSDTTPRGDGKYYILVNRSDDSNCCTFGDYTIISGGAGQFWCWWPCFATGFPNSGYTCGLLGQYDIWAMSLKFDEPTVLDIEWL